jgi:hypothetical protein
MAGLLFESLGRLRTGAGTLLADDDFMIMVPIRRAQSRAPDRPARPARRVRRARFRGHHRHCSMTMHRFIPLTLLARLDGTASDLGQACRDRRDQVAIPPPDHQPRRLEAARGSEHPHPAQLRPEPFRSSTIRPRPPAGVSTLITTGSGKTAAPADLRRSRDPTHEQVVAAPSATQRSARSAAELSISMPPSGTLSPLDTVG